jgi:hypothetical protein
MAGFGSCIIESKTRSILTYVEMGIPEASPDQIALFDFHRRKTRALRDRSINSRLTIQPGELGPQTCYK